MEDKNALSTLEHQITGLIHLAQGQSILEYALIVFITFMIGRWISSFAQRFFTRTIALLFGLILISDSLRIAGFVITSGLILGVGLIAPHIAYFLNYILITLFKVRDFTINTYYIFITIWYKILRFYYWINSFFIKKKEHKFASDDSFRSKQRANNSNTNRRTKNNNYEQEYNDYSKKHYKKEHEKKQHQQKHKENSYKEHKFASDDSFRSKQRANNSNTNRRTKNNNYEQEYNNYSKKHYKKQHEKKQQQYKHEEKSYRDTTSSSSDSSSGYQKKSSSSNKHQEKTHTHNNRSKTDTASSDNSLESQLKNDPTYSQFFSSSNYIILGVDSSMSFKEIKKAYRKLIRIHHPDLNPDIEEIATIVTQKINGAYASLEQQYS